MIVIVVPSDRYVFIDWLTLQSLIPLEYTVSIDHQSNTWSGEASIPVAYLPPSVNKFNAFAIHGTDPDRCYEALYPQKEPITNPDL